jgi:ketosteroid isomerase-like protein
MTEALAVARSYHDGWSRGRYAESAALLAPDVVIEVPVNSYPTKESFAAAVASFGAIATSVELLSVLGGDGEATVLYDMTVQGLGALRVCEHFTVEDGRITRLRQIHDTAALRAAGMVG